MLPEGMTKGSIRSQRKDKIKRIIPTVEVKLFNNSIISFFFLWFLIFTHAACPCVFYFPDFLLTVMYPNFLDNFKLKISLLKIAGL